MSISTTLVAGGGGESREAEAFSPPRPPPRDLNGGGAAPAALRGVFLRGAQPTLRPAFAALVRVSEVTTAGSGAAEQLRAPFEGGAALEFQDNVLLNVLAALTVIGVPELAAGGFGAAEQFRAPFDGDLALEVDGHVFVRAACRGRVAFAAD